LRTPEATSIGRVKGFNRKGVSEFFHILKTAFEKNHFSNIAYENDTFITQFSEENRRLHH
jgi:hypothetical protein